MISNDPRLQTSTVWRGTCDVLILLLLSGIEWAGEREEGDHFLPSSSRVDGEEMCSSL